MKSFILITGFFFMFVISVSQPTAVDHSYAKFPLNVMQTIRKYGYPAEAHVIETADGYLLEMHRIPHGQFSKGSPRGKKPPIFIQHGLLGSSAEFFLVGEDSLPFLLADLGFDVWLGNVRGNVYSRAHVTLFPDDKRFWNFTWHESAIYDVPAQIDFICNQTQQEKVIFIGYSMGATIFLAMTSTLPEYNDKIELSLLMGPIAYLKNIKSPLLRLLVPFARGFKDMSDLVDNGAFLKDSKLVKYFAAKFCNMSKVENSMCSNIVFLMVGFDPKEFDKSLLSKFFIHLSGYSAKGMNHYAQLVKSGKFRQYDYGRRKNTLQYGSPTPPDYDLSLITTPIYIYQAQNDFLCDSKDVNHLTDELESLISFKTIDYPKFSHLDYIMSLHLKTLVHDVVIDDLMSYLNDTSKI